MISSYTGRRCFCFLSFWVFALNLFSQQNTSVAKEIYSLKKNNSETLSISLSDAFFLALNQESNLNLAKNRLALTRAQKISRIAVLLPKLKGNMRYTKNLPEIKSSLAPSNAGQASLYRRVGGLLAAAGDTAGQEEMESAADQMLRRSSGGEIITKPDQAIDATLSLEIPIFNGPDYARLFAGNDTIKLEEARLKEQIASTLYSVASAYLSALHQQELVALKNIEKNTALESYLNTKKRYELGLLNKADKLNSESHFEQQNIALANAQLSLENSFAQLGHLLGKDSRFYLQPVQNEWFQILEGSEEALLDLALKSRPDLKAQEQAFSVAKRDHLGGILQFLPTLSLQADANYTSNTKGLVSEPVTYGIFLNANYVFFNGGARYGALKESSLKRAAETIKLTELKRKINLQVRGRNQSLLIRKNDIVAKKLRVDFAEENYKIKKSEYEKGLLSFADFLEAEQLIFSTQIDHEKAQANLKEEQLKFIYELGLLDPNLLIPDKS